MPKTKAAPTRFNDWLEISTEGFAQRQADRKPEHLLKEVIQNALDATDENEDNPPGRVEITIEPTKRRGQPDALTVTVLDNGPGVENLKDLRTVFCSSKEDRETFRGRMGQGLKEVLCICHEAEILTRGHKVRFLVEKGQRFTEIKEWGPTPGTIVTLVLPWPPKVVPQLESYLRTLIVPANRTVTVNGAALEYRKLDRTIEITAKTEIFADGKWVRRPRKGELDLVPLKDGEEPYVYEMGIPIQEIDWQPRYHINVQMRVPMNPRRDAVAAGYLPDLYRQILPVLMDQLQAEDLRNEWVSSAIERVAPEMQQEIVTRAFGPEAVRSVPTMGRYDWDSDARELGRKPIDTRLLPQGLRTVAESILPSSKQVELDRRATITVVAQGEVDPDNPIKRFYAKVASMLVGFEVDVRIVPEIVLDGKPAVAAWQSGGIMLLSQAYKGEWSKISERGFGILVHEVAHEDAQHHGDDFRRNVERMAGRLALLCLNRGDEIRALIPA